MFLRYAKEVVLTYVCRQVAENAVYHYQYFSKFAYLNSSHPWCPHLVVHTDCNCKQHMQLSYLLH